MSATVAAALKKIAVWLLTNKKVMKTVLGIVLGVILIIVMPIVAILGIFSGGVEIDTGRLHEMIAEQQTVSAERWAEVENAMKSAGYNAARIQEAKTLFVYVLYEYSEAADFTDMPDIGADTMYNNANEKGTIDTIPEIPGLAVWHEGHIGVYIGNGEVVQAANTEAGVIRNSMTDTAWTHWLKIPYIHYLEETEENPSG